MAKAYTNVNSTTGTFAGWLSKSNELFYDMSTMIVTVADVSAPNSSNEARTTGNADIQGIFSANNIVVWDTLAGGRNEEWANTDTLYIVSNTQIGNSSQTDTLTVYGDATFDANVQIGSAATDGLTIAANTVVNGLSFFTANTRFNDNVRLSLGTIMQTLQTLSLKMFLVMMYSHLRQTIPHLQWQDMMMLQTVHLSYFLTKEQRQMLQTLVVSSSRVKTVVVL